MKVAVTGGSGVVGRALVRHLVAEGHEVSALARSAEAAAKLDEGGARVVQGDVTDRAAVDRLVRGNERVFHVAGVNELCPRDISWMWKVNVDAVLGVLDASQRAGVARLIHTSSAVTIGQDHGVVATETTRHRGHFLSEYERSKTVAERLVLDRSPDLDVVSVNPASVQGPGRSTGTGALLLAAARGRLRFAVDSAFSIVDIDDCARGHLLAAEKGQRGQRYLLSGSTVTTVEMVRVLNRVMDRRGTPWLIDPRVLTAVAPVAGTVSRRLGTAAPLCPESVRVLLAEHRYDGSRATRELGLEYTPLEETLRRTVDWFRSEGLL